MGRLRFATIAGAFDVVFTDQYGVLHDGHRPYPGAVAALTMLRRQGARVVILSNSGRSGEVNAKRLAGLGFARDLYDHFLTSGDVAKSYIASGRLPIGITASTRCLAVSTGDGSDLALALGLSPTQDGAEADLVVIGGSRGDRIPLDDYRRLLAPAAARGTPCLCINPDKIMLTATGTAFGAGRIAELYEELGGPVEWIGKPFPMIYEAAATLADVTDPAEVLCIGDSIEHDVVGARRFGAAALLVRTGIHASLTEAELAGEMDRHGAVPDCIVQDLE